MYFLFFLYFLVPIMGLYLNNDQYYSIIKLVRNKNLLPYQRHKINTILYKSHEKKNGKMKFKMNKIEFIVEVGHRYIAKSLAIYNNIGDNVKCGQHLGDILIGSYCVVKIQKPCKIHVKVGYNLRGGISTNPIAEFI